MKRIKPAALALALSSVTALGCAALPPPLPRGSDPANPHAPEAPAVAVSPVLKSDPPPAPALQPPAAGDGMQMGGESMQDGPSDAGSTMPEQHHDHHGAQPAKPSEARDGGSP
jgi:hypothetical protein